MCISQPKQVAPAAVPTPTNTQADGLQLGTATMVARSNGILGRLALTGGAASARTKVDNASAPIPNAPDSSGAPGGTVGLPSDYSGWFDPSNGNN